MWLVNGHVVDVSTGMIRRDAAVEVADGRITRIIDGSPQAASAERIDCGGRYLTPGLISVHTHLSVVYPFSATDEDESPGASALRAASRATDALRAGVTTIRTLHEFNQADLLLRTAAQEGWLRTPRILASGRALSITGGHGRDLGCVYADGHDGFLRAARAELAAGADHIKIFITGGIAHLGETFNGAQMTSDEIKAVVRATQEQGTYVVAHAGGWPAIREAMDAGVRGFEHGYDLDDATAVEMARRGVFLTPTLSVTRCPQWMADHDFTQWQIDLAMRVGPGHLESIERAVRAGVTLVNGTDYPPGEPIDGTVVAVREMEFGVDAGLSAAQALRTATVNAAQLLALEHEIGVIEEGMAADIVAVPDDPTRDISAMRHIDFVMSQGEVIRDDRTVVGAAAGTPA